MTTITADDVPETSKKSAQHPGARLAKIRKEKGFTTEYVANKLHLRVQIVELLEADNYENMPEPVFIKGYFRAYAKLLDTDPAPLLAQFNSIYSREVPPERTLWQSRKQTNTTERAVRWMTLAFAISVFIAVAIWWHNYKNNEHNFAANTLSNETTTSKSEGDVKLTDLSKMRSLLSTPTQYSSISNNALNNSSLARSVQGEIKSE